LSTIIAAFFFFCCSLQPLTSTNLLPYWLAAQTAVSFATQYLVEQFYNYNYNHPCTDEPAPLNTQVLYDTAIGTVMSPSVI